MLHEMRSEARRLAAIAIDWKNISRSFAVGLVMFLLARARLMLGLSPLAAGFFAAALICGESLPGLIVGCALGTLGAEASFAGLSAPVSCAVVLTGFLGWDLLRRIEFKGIRIRISVAEEAVAGLLAGMGVLLPGLLAADGKPLDSAMALVAAIVAATAASAFLALPRLRWERSKLFPKERISLMLLACGCIVGLNGVSAFAADVAAFFGTGMLATVGCGAGAAAGVLLGAARCVGGAQAANLAAMALAGAISGLAWTRQGWQGRVLRGIGLTIGATLVWLYAAENAPAPMCALIAMSLLLAAPEKFLRHLVQWVYPGADGCDADALAAGLRRETERRLRAMSAAFGEMAEGYRENTEVPDEQALLAKMREILCAGCSGYEQCWLGDDNRAVRFLCQLVSEAVESGGLPSMAEETPPEVLRICKRGRAIPDRLGGMLEEFSRKRTQELKRGAVNRLISAQFLQARTLLTGLADAQAKPLKVRGRHAALAAAALDSAGIAATVLALRGERMELSVTLKREVWTKELEETAGRCLTEAFGRKYVPDISRRDDETTERRFVRLPALAVESGAGCISGIPGMPSGDSHAVRALDANTLAVMLSDGMGSGEAAARESARTLRLLWRFLSAGVDRGLALETVNELMLARSGEDMFATVDLCLIDLAAGRATFSKLAACRSLILREGRVRSIEGGRLPLGILEKVRPSEESVDLCPGDTILLFSDGVEDAVGDAGALESMLAAHEGLAPTEIANAVLREAEARRGSRADDMTVMCLTFADRRSHLNSWRKSGII